MDGCKVCGGPLPAWFRGDICSAKCRQKKSRDRRDAGKRAALAARQIESLANAYKAGGIDQHDAIVYHNLINSKLKLLSDVLIKELSEEHS